MKDGITEKSLNDIVASKVEGKSDLIEDKIAEESSGDIEIDGIVDAERTALLGNIIDKVLAALGSDNMASYDLSNIRYKREKGTTNAKNETIQLIIEKLKDHKKLKFLRCLDVMVLKESQNFKVYENGVFVCPFCSWYNCNRYDVHQPQFCIIHTTSIFNIFTNYLFIY